MLLIFLAVTATIGISNEDYPMDALRHSRDGVVGIQYKVDVSGRVSECRVTLTSGWPDLDAATCAAILKRGRFQPATDPTGSPVSDLRQLRYHWALPPGAAVSRFSSLPVTGELAVSALPKDAVRPSVNVTFQVGADGKIADCVVKEGDGTGSAVLDKAACDTIRANGLPVVRDGAGKAMSYTRVMTVTFIVPASQGAVR
jgi:TonB family protein